MEFETLFKLVVVAVTAVGLPIGAYAALAAIRATWGRPGAGAVDPRLNDEVEMLRSRVAELEVLGGRMVELEERLDFAERLLAEGGGARRLPGPVGREP
jgi:hypothetical protein